MTRHPTALVDPGATVAPDVEIGPFSVVGPGVRIGAGCRLGPRVSVQGMAVLGRDNILHAHVTVGKPGGGPVELGDGNVLRESTQVAPPSDAGATRIGSRNRLGTWVSIGPGSTVGDDTRLGSFCALGARSVVEDGARIEGQCVIEDGIRVGRGSRTCSQVPVSADVPPQSCLDGNPAELRAPEPGGGRA